MAHMVLCAVTEGEDDGLMSDTDLIADILAGYANDPWYADEASIAKEQLRLVNGAYFRYSALLCPTSSQSRTGSCRSCMNQTMLGMWAFTGQHTVSSAYVGGLIQTGYQTACARLR